MGTGRARSGAPTAELDTYGQALSQRQLRFFRAARRPRPRVELGQVGVDGSHAGNRLRRRASKPARIE